MSSMRRLLEPCLVAALILCVAAPGLAQNKKKKKKKSPPDPNVPGVQVFEEKEADKRRTRKRKDAPTFKLDTARTTRQKAAADMREQVIQAALDIIEIDDPASKDYPKALIKLADQYWQKSEDYFDMSQGDKLLKSVYDAEENKDQATLAKLRSQQQALLAEQTKWRREAVETYRRIEKDHSQYKDLDQVLYSIGYHSTLMGERKVGVEYYAKLVRQRPQSPLVPDSLLNIGDYFFGNNEFQQALAFYDKVRQFGKTRVYGYAVYKSGWAWFNLGDKAKALNEFYETVKWTRIAEKEGMAAALDLRSEAQNDMVRAYSFIGAPQKAVPFFKQIAPEIYVKLCEKLGIIYTNDSNYGSSNRLYKALITEVGKDDYRGLQYQREIVYNTFKSGDKNRTKGEVESLTTALTHLVGKLPKDFKAEEMRELELLLRVIGTDYHREAEKTQEQPTQLLALTVYRAYLKWFPKAKDYYTMNFNVAILAYQMGEYQDAAELFEKVIELKPNGPYTAHAAHTSLLSYYKLVEVQASLEKQEDIDDKFEPKKIPEMEKLLVGACERYIKLAPPEADDVAEAKFAAAKIYYDYNYFKEAEQYFTQLYTDHKDHPSVTDAGRLLLSIFNVTRNIEKLEVWADKFALDPNIAQGAMGVKIQEIQAARDFNKCRKLEFEKSYAKSGDCFMAYFRNFKQNKLGDKALNNAAIMYKEARLIQKALVASEVLYNERHDSPMAPRALYNIGQIYSAIAVYSEAAHYFELYAANHPKHNTKLLAKALKQSVVYRMALQDYDKAATDAANYYKNFSKRDDAQDVFFDIGVIYENQKNWKAVTKHFKKYLKSYKTAAPLDKKVSAHSKMGVAWWKMNKKKKALKEFDIALQIFTDAKSLANETGKDLDVTPRAAEAVAAAKFHQGEVVLAKMKSVRLQLPQKKFTARLQRKITLIGQATERMQEVAQFERPQWEIAAFNRIGQAYQNLADAIETAPLPKRMPEEARYMLQEDFRRKANEVRAKAIEAYRICLDRAKKKQWFNDFSENAEKNLAVLDMKYKFTRELRPQPVQYREMANVPPWRTAAGLEGAVASAKKIAAWKPGAADVKSVVGKFRSAGTADGLYNAGLALVRAGSISEALAAFKQSASKNAQDADAHAMVGEMMRRSGQDGEEFTRAALKLQKFNPIANNTFSVGHQSKKDWTKAIARSRQALIGDAEDLNAYQNLARTYFEQGQYNMAKLVAEQGIRYDKANAPLRNLLGLTLIKMDDVRSALRRFRGAVKGDKRCVECQINLAATVMNYSDFGAAQKHFQAALEVQPDSDLAVLGDAVAARGLTKFEDARKGYDSLLAKNPDAVDVLYNKCLLIAQYEEKFEEGLSTCEQFLAKAPSAHPRRKEMEQRVKGLQDTIKFMKEEEQFKKDNPDPAPVDPEAAQEEKPEGEPKPEAAPKGEAEPEGDVEDLEPEKADKDGAS